jgi:hypothetical protein
VPKVLKEVKEHRVRLKEHKVLKELKGHKELQEHKGYHKEHKVL